MTEPVEPSTLAASTGSGGNPGAQPRGTSRHRCAITRDDYWERSEGTPYPLGATLVEDGQALNFALYGKHAESVTLLLFADNALCEPLLSYAFNRLKNKSGPIWHCRLRIEEVGAATFYAYQVDGPTGGSAFHWHAFDPAKLLLDPYARAVFFPPTFSRQAAIAPGSNMGQAPLGMLAPTFAPVAKDGDHRQQSGHIIYEMHVRGFTRRAESGVAADRRGTFAGVIDKIPYLQDLGVTAVELMPVYQFDPQENNYWGYMPLNFFSPHQQYSCRPQAKSPHHEFREMVEALHAAKIEVILDVVYNHTCELDQSGPTYSFKGIDNSTYYLLTADPQHPYANYSGTGNTFRTGNRGGRRLIVDSLRFWVEQMRVDGFRFDLASIFSRGTDGEINLSDPPIFDQIAGDAEFDGIHLIAEPWDAGGLFQLGSKFPGLRWMQWNARYRDTLQRFVRGDGGLVADLMTRVYGSADLFPDDLTRAYRPYQSVNYVASHDGSTLYDLVSYNQKHNWANGHDNTDGSNEYSWNCGCEGSDGLTPEIMRLRKQQVKNFFTLLLLSNGTPMFRMGDEFLQTQQGNNNPYNQDNETTWLDWRLLDEHHDMFRFVSLAICFRKSHRSIGRAHFWREDVAWYGAERPVDMSERSQTLAYCVHGASYEDDDVYTMVNAGPQPVAFGIQEGELGSWRRVIDTAEPAGRDILEPGRERAVNSPYYQVQAHSVVVLVRGAQGAATTPAPGK